MESLIPFDAVSHGFNLYKNLPSSGIPFLPRKIGGAVPQTLIAVYFVLEYPMTPSCAPGKGYCVWGCKKFEIKKV